jgi:hypothetical protein
VCVCVYALMNFYFCGTTAQIEPRFKYCRLLRHTAESPPRNEWPARHRGRYTTHSKHNGRTYMLSVGFEPAVQKVKRFQTNALDFTVTSNGPLGTYLGVFPAKRGNVLRFLCFLTPNERLKSICSYWYSIAITRYKMKKLGFVTQGAEACVFVSK